MGRRLFCAKNGRDLSPHCKYICRLNFTPSTVFRSSSQAPHKSIVIFLAEIKATTITQKRKYVSSVGSVMAFNDPYVSKLFFKFAMHEHDILFVSILCC